MSCSLCGKWLVICSVNNTLSTQREENKRERGEQETPSAKRIKARGVGKIWGWFDLDGKEGENGNRQREPGSCESVWHRNGVGPRQVLGIVEEKHVNNIHIICINVDSLLNKCSEIAHINCTAAPWWFTFKLNFTPTC